MTKLKVTPRARYTLEFCTEKMCETATDDDGMFVDANRHFLATASVRDVEQSCNGVTPQLVCPRDIGTQNAISWTACQCLTLLL